MSKYNTILSGEKKAILGFTMCNFGGLVIFELTENNAVSGFDFGNGPQDVRQTKIHYDRSGNAYILRFNKKYYLHDIYRL